MIAVLLVAAAVLAWPGGPATARLRELTGGGAESVGVVSVRLMSDRVPTRVLVPAAAGLAAGVVGGPWHAAAAAMLGATVWELRRRGRHHREQMTALGAWERALDDAASALRAGVDPAEALVTVAETTSPGGAEVGVLLRAARAHARLGGDVAAVLRTGDDPVAADLAGAWQLTSRHGVPLAAVVDGLRADVASRRERGTRVDAALAGPRATAMILTALPGFGVLLGSGFGADPLGVLVSGPLGGVLSLIGVMFLSAGLLWTDRIVDGARR